MGAMTKVTAAAAAAVLIVGLGACGDDDDDETGAGTEETSGADGGEAGGDDAFCEALIEFNGAVMETDIHEEATEEEIKAAGEELSPLFEAVAQSAPDDLKDTADELNATIQPLTEGDAEAFNEDATFETYTTFVGDAVGVCEFEAVEVTAVDYAFEGVPETIPAGTTAFEFTNASEAEEHEMIIMRKADGVALSWDELLELPEEEAQTKVEFKGAAFAPPGEGGATLAELAPGDYAMLCFIPVGGGEDGPPHFTQGMVQEFTVE